MGPLEGTKIVEFAGIGPAPFCATLLADLGAQVIRIARTATVQQGTLAPEKDFLLRGRKSICLDLKSAEGARLALRLVSQADVVLEGFRPGVMERLGLGPELCLAENPRVVFGRMTGWGQTGVLAHAAGHDINYIALSGVLAHIGPAGEKPVLPLNLAGDFGGGGMLLAMGVLAALVERERSGRGQVVDAAIVDGAATLMGLFYAQYNAGDFQLARGTSVLSGASHYYDVYETSDGQFVTIGSGEPQFYRLLLKLLDLEEANLPPQNDTARWPEMKARFAEIFKVKTRDEWCALLEGADVCFAPVLSLAEAPHHPHNRQRNAFVDVGGGLQPAPSPRFSRTPAGDPRPGASPSPDSDLVLMDWNFDRSEIDDLRASGTLR